MIQDGVIVIGSPPDLWNWSFDSELLNVLVMGVLSTILSYQLIATCYNVLLGWKTRGTATACDLQKLLLVESSSPLEIFSAVARLDAIDRIRFRRDFPKNAKIVRRDTKVKKQVVSNLLILLLIAPACNLVTTFVGLGRERGLNVLPALGISNRSVDFRSFTDNCNRIPVRLVHGARAVGVFGCTICFDFQVDLLATERSEQIRLAAESTFEGAIKVSVIGLPAENIYSARLHIDMVSSEQGLFRVQPIFSQDDAVRVIYDGQNKLADYCSNAKIQDSPQDENLIDFAESIEIEESESNVVKASKDFNCSLREIKEFVAVLVSLGEPINPVEHENPNVANVDDLGSEGSNAAQFFDARELKPFVVQPGRLVNILPFLAITVLSVIIRILTGWAFNNDIEEGIEAVLRYRLGIRPEESLLRSSRTITYNSKWQDGLTAHYGLPKPSLQEVKRFENGIEIGKEENPGKRYSVGTNDHYDNIAAISWA